MALELFSHKTALGDFIQLLRQVSPGIRGSVVVLSGLEKVHPTLGHFLLGFLRESVIEVGKDVPVIEMSRVDVIATTELGTSLANRYSGLGSSPPSSSPTDA